MTVYGNPICYIIIRHPGNERCLFKL